MSHPFPLSVEFGTLAGDLGSFPFDNETYLPLSASHGVKFIGIRSLIEVGNPVRPLAQSVLYLRRFSMRRYLNSFRGEPAITQFDWPFTPKHNSSEAFSTATGSVLHALLRTLQPGHA
jgi:hypothetical protein